MVGIKYTRKVITTGFYHRTSFDLNMQSVEIIIEMALKKKKFVLTIFSLLLLIVKNQLNYQPSSLSKLNYFPLTIEDNSCHLRLNDKLQKQTQFIYYYSVLFFKRFLILNTILRTYYFYIARQIVKFCLKHGTIQKILATTQSFNIFLKTELFF